jgi:ATP adenylyltransferase
VTLYHLPNARTDVQRDDMRRLEEAGVCIFCEPTTNNDPRSVLHRTAGWSVRTNTFPYAGTSLHLLLVPVEHVADMLDLTPAVRDDFWNALAWVREHHDLSYYGLGIRNGDFRFTGGTVEHVHVHVIVADPDADRPVRLRLSSRPA